MTKQKLDSDKEWVLFDTCVVSRIINNPDEGSKIIKQIETEIGNFTACITPYVRFEILRSIKECSKNQFETLKEKVEENYAEISIESDDDRYNLFDFAAEMACAYRLVLKKQNKDVGFVDFMHGALLRRYPNHLYLLTINIDDFPVPLFEIVAYGGLKNGTKVESWALLKIDKIQFSRYYEIYKKNNLVSKK